MDADRKNITVPIVQLYTAPEYQRERINKKKVSSMVKEWDWDVYTPIKVSVRHNEPDKYYIVEGQHRVTAAGIKGFIELSATIVETQNVAEEAALFRAINRAGSALPLSLHDDWKAALVAEDPEITKINNTLKRYGFNVASHGDDNCISCVSTLKRLCKKYDATILAFTLDVLRRAFDGASVSLKSKFLTGLAHFLYSYFFEEKFDIERFINKLRKIPAENILRDLNRKTTVGNFGLVANEVFVSIYNYKSQDANRLTLKA